MSEAAHPDDGAHSGLTALHALCRLSARLEAADDDLRATLIELAAPNLERLVSALCHLPRAPGFFDGREPLLVSAMTLVGSDAVSRPPEAGARFLETLVTKVADPKVALSSADVEAIERSLDDVARPTRRLFIRALRERRNLTASRAGQSERARRRAADQL